MRPRPGVDAMRISTRHLAFTLFAITATSLLGTKRVAEAQVSGDIAVPGASAGDTGWVFKGQSRQVDHLGRHAIQIRTGSAYRRDLVFADGTIEFDFAPVSERRYFLGLMFRMSGEDDWEDIFFRPHSLGGWDALQYEGVWATSGSWQLYSGPGANAAVPFTPGRWTHVKVVVRGLRAEVYYDGSDSAALVIPELKRGRTQGFVGFWGLYPQAGKDTSYLASFSNLTVRPGVFDSGKAADPPLSAPKAGTIAEWLVSPPRPAPDVPFPDRLDAGVAGDRSSWRLLTAEPNGLINITRAFPPPSARRGEIFARAQVRAHTARLAKLDFGYSDDVAIYLNGRAVYTGANGSGARYPRSLGILTLDVESVFLPLRAGLNELVFAVRDDLLFGWGFAARLVDPSGLVVTP
jgi:hypothetical protein